MSTPTQLAKKITERNTYFHLLHFMFQGMAATVTSEAASLLRGSEESNVRNAEHPFAKNDQPHSEGSPDRPGIR